MARSAFLYTAVFGHVEVAAGLKPHLGVRDVQQDRRGGRVTGSGRRLWLWLGMALLWWSKSPP